ncbi:MAG: GGDEF domain-containing protein, partial [Chloroflexi bacterium]|nr:GGDEF domain-containing protein [Chloroflexota bacterium]
HGTDSVGRWGGEEFGVALVGADVASARRVAQRIRRTLLRTEIKGKDGALVPAPTVSQGIANIPTHARDTSTLIDLADAALYQAKLRGRDQVQIAVPGLKEIE